MDIRRIDLVTIPFATLRAVALDAAEAAIPPMPLSGRERLAWKRSVDRGRRNLLALYAKPYEPPPFSQDQVIWTCIRCGHMHLYPAGADVAAIEQANPACEECESTLDGKRPPERWERVRD